MMMMMMMAVVGVDLVRFGYDCQDPWQHDDQWFSTNEETTTSRIAPSFFRLLCCVVVRVPITLLSSCYVGFGRMSRRLL